MSTNRRQPWQHSFDALCAFIHEHGHNPTRSKTAPKDELSLHYFMNRQRERATPEQAALLDEHAPGWRGGTRRTQEQLLADIEAFIREHGHIPRGSGPTAERTMYSWIKEQRSRGYDHPAVRRLDAIAPGWRAPRRLRNDRRFMEQAAELGQFLSRHGRLPSAYADSEASLARWLNFQIGSATPTQRSVLDSVAPGWDTSRSAGRRRDDQVFEQRLTQLLEFVRTNDRRPNPSASDHTERSLAGWFERLKYKRDDRLAVVIAALPPQHRPASRRPRPVITPAFTRRVQSLAAFYAEHGRLPRQTAPSGSPESSLGNWLKSERARQVPERIAAINAAIPGAGTKGGFQAGRARYRLGA